MAAETNSINHHYHIIGHGAQGLTLAFHLQQMQLPFSLWGRPESNSSTQIHTHTHTHTHKHFINTNTQQKFSFVSKPFSWKFVSQSSANLFFVALKAYSLPDFFTNILSQFPSPPDGSLSTTIVFLSNGAIDQLCTQLLSLMSQISQNKISAKNLKFRQGICTFGTTNVDENSFKLVSSAGEVIFGPYLALTPSSNSSLPTPSPIEQALCNSPNSPFFKWHHPISPLVQEKWINNVVINSLCAAHDFPCNGKILTEISPSYLQSLFQEALQLKANLWPQLNIDPTFQSLISLIKKTSANENSMRADLRRGNPTENLYLAAMARPYSPQFPLLQELDQKISTREADKPEGASRPETAHRDTLGLALKTPKTTQLVNRE